MKLRTALVVATLTLAHSSVLAQQKSEKMSEPIVHAGLFAVRSDGLPAGSAVQTGDGAGADMAGTVYLAPCESIGASNPGWSLSAAATEAWKLSGRVIALTDIQATVQIGWQRIRRNGQDESSAPQATTVTLNRGDRVTLEQVSVPAAGECQPRAASLVVLFASMEERMKTVATSLREGDHQGAGGAARVFTDADGAVRSVQIAKSGEAAPTTLMADLWLVRSVPGQPDQTQHITSMVVAMPREFRFKPVSVASRGGVTEVNFSGAIEAGLSREGQRQLFFSANRTATFRSTTLPARDVAPVAESGARTAVPVPTADEVLSFELPPLKVSEATFPDRFSIRVRITPRAIREGR